MKRALGVAAAATLFGSIASPASAADQNIPLQAVVSSFCRVSGELVTATDLTQTIGITNGMITGSAITRQFPVICNRATNISLTSINGGLNGQAAATGFEHIINYTTTVSGFATVASATTATIGGATGNEPLGTATRLTPGSEDITVVITPVANVLPLVEGTYNDVLRLSIVPQN